MELISAAALASATAAFIAPHLPWLTEKVVTSAAAEAGKRALGGAVDSIKALWAGLWPKASAVESAKKAIDRAAEKPADTRVIGALELELEDLFKDPALARAIKLLLDKAEADVKAVGGSADVLNAIGAGAVAAKGTFSNSPIVTGTYTTGGEKPKQ
jgi:hypothetical protein